MKKTLNRLFRLSTSSNGNAARNVHAAIRPVIYAAASREFSGQEISGTAASLLANAQIDAVLASVNPTMVPAGLAERVQAQVRQGFVAEELQRQRNASAGSFFNRILPASLPAWRHAGIGAFALAACLVVASWAGSGQMNSSILTNHRLTQPKRSAALGDSPVSSPTAASAAAISGSDQGDRSRIAEGMSPATVAPIAAGNNAALDILARGNPGRSFGAAGAQSLAPAPLRAGTRRGRVQRQTLAGRATLGEGERGSAGVHVLPGGQPLLKNR